MPQAVRSVNIQKRFGGHLAVKGVSFEVPQSGRFALLGPNGAGKSTLIRMLTTLIEPTAGTAEICGHDVRKDAAAVRRSIGVVPQNHTTDPDLTAYENMTFYAGLYGVAGWRRRKLIEPLLASVDLLKWRDKKTGTFSGGMRRRLEVARSLIHRPQVLFLDEPTTGLDPAARIAMWQMIRRVQEEVGLTLFLTTHYMEEADVLCDTIAIVDDGTVIAMGTPAELKAKLPVPRSIDVTFIREPESWMEVLSKLPGVAEVRAEDGRYHIESQDLDRCLHALLDAASEHDSPVGALKVTGNTLEDVFVYYTGRDARDSAGGRVKHDVSHLYNRGNGK
jgi:ABC-2 type transport system ATP-binding protein